MVLEKFMQNRENVLVYPGGSHEVLKHSSVPRLVYFGKNDWDLREWQSNMDIPFFHVQVLEQKTCWRLAWMFHST